MIHSETREDARHVNSKSDFHGIFRYKYVEYRSLEGIEQGIPQVGAILSNPNLLCAEILALFVREKACSGNCAAGL